MDFCLILSAPWLPLPLWGLLIFTGEPLMLTKALVLLTDLLTGGFFPTKEAGLVEGRELEAVLAASFNPERTGEERFLAGDEGVKNFSRGETGLGKGVFTAGTGEP